MIQWGTEQTLAFHTNREPSQISENKKNGVISTPISGGRRKQTRRKQTRRKQTRRKQTRRRKTLRRKQTHRKY